LNLGGGDREWGGMAKKLGRECGGVEKASGRGLGGNGPPFGSELRGGVMVLDRQLEELAKELDGLNKKLGKGVCEWGSGGKSL
jgi:hypothetical protein